MYTNHAYHRNRRLSFIENVIGVGECLEKFNVDKRHVDGPEIHIVTTTGIIAIYNAYTKRFITALIARPGQIERYYRAEHRNAPGWLIRIAMEHQRKRWNYL